MKSFNRQKRIVVCGFGAVTPLGLVSLTDESLWTNVLAAKTMIRPFTFEYDKERIAARVASEMTEFNFKPYALQIPRLAQNIVDRPKPDRWDLSCQIGATAALFACQMAGINLSQTHRHPEIGVSVGSGLGGGRAWEAGFQNFLNSKLNHLLFTVINVMNNATAGYISGAFGFGGHSVGNTAACASSGYAIAAACDQIRLGRAKAMLAVGTETSATPFQIACFNTIKALSRSDSPRASLPFGLDRDGFVMGEGAGALFLADLDWAKAQGLPILAEILGYATNSGATDMFDPNPEYAAECMEMAIDDAQISPANINYINTHGTATPVGDIAEAYAISKVFMLNKPYFAKPPLPLINSSKALLGHTLGASGALELILTILSLRDGVVHPMGDYELDPKCLRPPHSQSEKDCFDLSLPIVKDLTKAELSIALSNAFGFGDHNVSIIVARPDLWFGPRWFFDGRRRRGNFFGRFGLGKILRIADYCRNPGLFLKQRRDRHV